MKNKNFSYLVLSVFILLFILSIFVLWKQSKTYSEKLIQSDIKKIHKVLKHIHQTCEINGFTQDQSLVDFLNIKSFAGSTVGALNLTYPSKWEGPYLKTNPTIQEKFYEIVKNKTGYYIVPGHGVKLSNNKIIGKEIILDYNTDLEKELGKLVQKINLDLKQNDEPFINPFISVEDREGF